MSQLPSSWTEAAASQLLQENIGGVWGRQAGSQELDVSVVRIADFRDDGSIDFVSAPRRSVTVRQLQSRELRLGDILLEKSGGGPTKPVGRVVRVKKTPGLAIPTNFVQLLRPKLEVVNPGFLFWWFWWSHLNGSTAVFQRATTNIRNLRTQDYLDRRVPLPPLNEQHRIVAVIEEELSRLDAAEDSLRRARRKLEILRERAIECAFTGDVPWTTLGEIAEIVGGVTKDTKRQADPSFVEVPYLRVANVQRGFLDLREVTTIRVPPDKAKVLELKPGDVLFNEGGDRDKLGRGWVWSGEIERCIHQNHVFRARLDDRFEPKFVSWHGNTFGRRWFEEHGRQTTNLASLNLTTLKSFPVPAPPLDAQRRIVGEIERQLSLADAMAVELRRTLRRSAVLRRSILEQAFTGKLIPQDASDEPASALLERVAAEQAATLSRRSTDSSPRGETIGAK